MTKYLDIFKNISESKMTELVLKSLNIEGYDKVSHDSGKILLHSEEDGSQETYLITIEKLC